MRDIYKIQEKVRELLTKYPETRNSDTDLYIHMCMDINEIACYLPFIEVLKNRKNLGMPSIESVGRIRRKLQAEYPELRAVEEVCHGREINRQRAVKYATE